MQIPRIIATGLAKWCYNDAGQERADVGWMHRNVALMAFVWPDRIRDRRKLRDRVENLDPMMEFLIMKVLGFARFGG